MSRMLSNPSVERREETRSGGRSKPLGQSRLKFCRQTGAAATHRINSCTPQVPKTAARISDKVARDKDSLFRNFREALEASKAYHRSALKPRQADIIRGERAPERSIVDTTVISS